MPTLHVAIAVLAGTTGGPASYGVRLVRELARRGDLRLAVITDRPARFEGHDVVLHELPMRGGLDRLRWQYWALPRLLRRLRPDVYHDTKNALPFGLSIPQVVTVHDLAYHVAPETFGFLSRRFLIAATAHATKRAAAIVVPSRATADDLCRIHPRSAGKVHVVPHGIDPAPRLARTAIAEVAARLHLPRDYVLHVGTVQPRKNVHLVVDGVRRLRARFPALRALLVGRRGWLAGEAMRTIDADDTAVWLPHVAEADLPAVYAGARAFVSPSAYEGFGMAVGDALAAGVPTVVSRLGSLPELCGDAAIQLAELSGAAVAAALEAVLGDPTRANDLGAAGRDRAARFDWAASAAGHVAAYEAARRSPS